MLERVSDAFSHSASVSSGEEEGGDDAVEDVGPRVLVGELGVEHREPDRPGQVDVRLQEGDDLGARLRGRYDQNIFGISQDRIVK